MKAERQTTARTMNAGKTVEETQETITAKEATASRTKRTRQEQHTNQKTMGGEEAKTSLP